MQKNIAVPLPPHDSRHGNASVTIG